MTDAPPNALRQYLTEKDLSDREFAEMIVAAGQRVARSYITQLRLGLRKAPSLALALKIAAVTEGRVPVESWGETPPEVTEPQEQDDDLSEPPTSAIREDAA